MRENPEKYLPLCPERGFLPVYDLTTIPSRDYVLTFNLNQENTLCIITSIMKGTKFPKTIIY